MKKKNVIFIVIDAVRSYKSGLDERDRLEVFDQLAEREFFVLDKLVVSAPSSLMSSITMLTGLPSFSLAQNYNDFKWEEDLYNVIPSNLSEIGYDCYGLFGAKEMRDKLKDIFPPIQKEILPKGINITQRNWNNQSLLKVVKNACEVSIDTSENPFFLMTWFNSRFDTETSAIIDELLSYLSKKSYYDDSLIIVTADHGYPDQRRGLTSDGPDLKKSGKPHDLIVTDDNICVPLAIRFPTDYTENKTFLDKFPKRHISQALPQECLFPSISEVLDLNLEEKPLMPGRGSIRNELFEPNDSPIRSDARFMFQPNRITSVRVSDRKYVMDREHNEEFCYDLINDPAEKEKLSSSDINIADLKEFYEDSESEAFMMWAGKVSKNLDNIALQKFIHNGIFNVFYLGSTNFINPILMSLKKYNVKIHLHSNIKTLSLIEKGLFDTHSKLEKKVQVQKALVFVEDTLNPDFINLLRLINARSIGIVDPYMNIYSSRRKLVLRSFINWALGPFKRMVFKKDVYRSHPALFFDDIIYIINRVIILIYKKVKSFF